MKWTARRAPYWTWWFAWYPVRIEDQVVWLEWVYRHVEYDICGEPVKTYLLGS